MKDLDVQFVKFVGHLGKRQNWHKYDILVNCFSFFALRNSCFAGSEYEVGDGVFDVRVCQYDTPIGEHYAIRLLESPCPLVRPSVRPFVRP